MMNKIEGILSILFILSPSTQLWGGLLTMHNRRVPLLACPAVVGCVLARTSCSPS